MLMASATGGAVRGHAWNVKTRHRVKVPETVMPDHAALLVARRLWSNKLLSHGSPAPRCARGSLRAHANACATRRFAPRLAHL